MNLRFLPLAVGLAACGSTPAKNAPPGPSPTGGFDASPGASWEADASPGDDAGRPGTTIPTMYPTGAGPASVALGPDGGLVYRPDPSGDTVPDFSTAGYMGGGVALPTVPVATTLSPLTGETDASPRIQAALDALTKAPLARGVRGAVLLTAGVYPIATSITIAASGIVLRGAGSGAGSGAGVTILQIAASGATPAIAVRGTAGVTEVSGTEQALTDAYVPVGAKWFRVAQATGFGVGDDVVVHRPSSASWIAAISMGWAAGSVDMTMERKILAVEEDRLLLDGPITVAIDQTYGGGAVYKYTSGRIQNVGVEQIRGQSKVAVGANGDGAGQFIIFSYVEDGWVSQCTNDQIAGVVGESGTFSADHSKRLTIQDVTSIHNRPASTAGASVLDFTFKTSQLILFHRIVGTNGGIEFASQEDNTGPDVYLESKTPEAYAYTGPHYMWTAATLYDSLTLNQNLWLLQLGGNGWGGGNLVIWNTSATGTALCDRPATAHQWMFGVSSSQTTTPTAPRAGDVGALPCEWESFGATMNPPSLYRQQLLERLGPSAVATLGAE